MKRSRLNAMSGKRRAKLAAAGVANPFSTLVNGGAVGRGSVPRLAAPAPKQRRPRPAVPAHVRTALIARSSGWCEIARPGCTGQGTDPSHRISQKTGGRHGDAKVRHDRLSNLMWACRACHHQVTVNPAASKAEHVGWALEEWQNPAACPALYRGRLVLLADDGTVTRFIPNHTPNQQEVPA